MDKKRIAVVILNWNGADMMRRYLPFVIRNSQSLADVIVADNGSTDTSCTVVRDEFPEVRLIALPENYGFAEGYNRALAGLDYEFYLLLNSDIEPDADWLAPLLAYMDHHPEVAACQPKLLSMSERRRFEYAGAAGGFMDRYGYPFCRGRIFDTVEEDRGQYDTPAYVLWATGAALLIRRSDWESAGGLDGRFFAHQEEIDLCWRLGCRGRRVACVPQSRAWHVGGASLAQGNPRKTFLNFRNNLMMLYKNLPDGELRRVMRIRFWLDLLARIQFAVKGDWANARAISRARREFKAMRPTLRADRERNLQAATTDRAPGHTTYAILAAYHLKGKKRFCQL